MHVRLPGFTHVTWRREGGSFTFKGQEAGAWVTEVSGSQQSPHRASGGHPPDVRSALSRSAGARDAVWGVRLRLQEAGGCAVGGWGGVGVTTVRERGHYRWADAVQCRGGHCRRCG